MTAAGQRLMGQVGGCLPLDVLSTGSVARNDRLEAVATLWNVVDKAGW